MLLLQNSGTQRTGSAGPPVPDQYRQLYDYLNSTLDSYDAYLTSLNLSSTHAVTFAAELLPANGNRGTICWLLRR